MTTSGTYTFALSVADCVINAFGRIQLRGPAILAEHMRDARVESNLLLSEFANLGVTLFTVDLQAITTVPGTATYSIDPSTITMLDTYVEITNGASDPVDLIITSISRSTYAAQPDKETQARPTQFWFNRQINPTVTFWPTPDIIYTIKYYRYTQIQDASLANGQNPDLPYRYLDAFTAGLAWRMARLYQPQLEQIRKADYLEAKQICFTQDTEFAPLFITPGLSGYYQ